MRISKTLSSDPEKCCQEFINFLRSEAGLISDNDNEFNRHSVALSSKMDHCHVEIGWGKLQERARLNLIERYVDDQCRDKLLNREQRNHLRNTIDMGITLSVLTNDSFHLKNGEIVAISRLYFEPVSKRYWLDSQALDRSITDHMSYYPVRVDDLWHQNVNRNHIELIYNSYVKEWMMQRVVNRIQHNTF